MILLIPGFFLINSLKLLAFAYASNYLNDVIHMNGTSVDVQTGIYSDYYVSTAGNDNNSGLSPALAWKTIAKINSFTFSAGDRILFRRGDQWRETIIVKGSGSAGNYITYGAYGTGAKPIISGSDIVKGWTQYLANIWKANCPKVYLYLGLDYDYVAILDGILFKQVGTLAEVSAQNTYYIDKTTTPNAVYIYSNSNPDTKIAEVSARMFGFYVNSNTYIKLSGLEFRNAGHSGAFFFGGVNSQISGNSIIDSCNFYRNRIYGIELYDGYSNSIVQNCTSSFNGNGYYSASYTNYGSNGNIFRNCYSGHIIRYTVGIVTDGHGFGIYNSGDCIVEYCEAEYCYFGINVDPNNRANNFICRYNYIHDTDPTEAGICIGGNIPAGTIHQAYYNLIVNTGGGIPYPWAIAVGGPSRKGNVYLYNNTIFQDGVNGHRNGIMASNGSNLTIMNNIICSYSTSVTLLNIPTGSNLVCDNNCFYAPNVSANVFAYNNIYYHTLASWGNATGQDVHSFYGDPLCINKSSDWKLSASSPVINKGANVGLTSDFSGNPLVGLPDMGAFETQVVSNIPVYLSSAIENATPARLDITYNLGLANIVPAALAFSVKVNSVARTVNSVAVSGTKVSLTLSSPVVNGNVVTVAYTKPSTNPLQSVSGGMAASIVNQAVINNCISIPVTNGTTPVNQPPIITISNPSKGNKYEKLTTITIDAIASDPDGTISKVEFYNGITKLVELTSAPYSYTWKDIAPGTYSLTAIATDNLNATTTSSPVEFVVWPNIKYDANSEIINLFPNPNDGHFTINFIIPLLNEKSEIIITDLAGKQLYHEPIFEEETSKQFDLSNIKSGIYIMMIICKKILVTKKFIKN